jgi:hypothetical protein
LNGTVVPGDETQPEMTYSTAGMDPDEYKVCLNVTDEHGATDANCTTLEVTNTPPVADAGGPYLVAVNDAIQLNGSESYDPDGDALFYAWTVDDGTINASSDELPYYTAPANGGIFGLNLTVNDGYEDSTVASSMIVVYDPDGGFVTGGGWIISPGGAYAADSSLTGKASFGFVSKYKKGANEPTGNTDFQSETADLNFHASSYDWLVVAGNKAKLKGTGTVNGSGNFGFMLTAVDNRKVLEAKDTFRIKIWDKDDRDALVYDNQEGIDDKAYDGTAVRGGNIIVHTKK